MFNDNSHRIGKIPLCKASETVSNILNQLLSQNVKLDDYKINLSISIGKYHDSENSSYLKTNYSKVKPSTGTISYSKFSETKDVKKNCLICKKAFKMDSSVE
ncbi:Hypothetical protein SRAE_1000305100 [Strongyloides ratti]|uniref:Uncharacterized protein n=1 Tax=Strongyloides ratti TaxID=34506 RepID=A0A090L9K1_STRRB|nr:Hypothetical protein SRAE_1000305100 [Strongyloides ratti]CEF64798.1 Hypothetical protein SRAE_1000305100 [Strongyloides ratti]